MNLKDSVTLVTGGAGGLGLATAERLLAAGGKVVLVDLPTSAGADVAERLGDAALFAAADVTDSDQFDSALDVAQQLGTLRGMVLGCRTMSVDGRSVSVTMPDFEFALNPEPGTLNPEHRKWNIEPGTSNRSIYPARSIAVTSCSFSSSPRSMRASS